MFPGKIARLEGIGRLKDDPELPFQRRQDLGEEVSKIGWECCGGRVVWLETKSGDGGAEPNNTRQEQSSIGIERTAEKRHDCGCGKKVWQCSVNMRGDDGAVESWALVGRIPQSHCRAPNETRACAAVHHHPFPFHSSSVAFHRAYSAIALARSTSCN